MKSNFPTSLKNISIKNSFENFCDWAKCLDLKIAWARFLWNIFSKFKEEMGNLKYFQRVGSNNLHPENKKYHGNEASED